MPKSTITGSFARRPASRATSTADDVGVALRKARGRLGVHVIGALLVEACKGNDSTGLLRGDDGPDGCDLSVEDGNINGAIDVIRRVEDVAAFEEQVVLGLCGAGAPARGHAEGDRGEQWKVQRRI